MQWNFKFGKFFTVIFEFKVQIFSNCTKTLGFLQQFNVFLSTESPQHHSKASGGRQCTNNTLYGSKNTTTSSYMVVICSNELILKIKLENMIMKIVETALCEGFKSSNVLDFVRIIFSKGTYEMNARFEDTLWKGLDLYFWINLKKIGWISESMNIRFVT